MKIQRPKLVIFKETSKLLLYSTVLITILKIVGLAKVNWITILVLLVTGSIVTYFGIKENERKDI